MFKKLFFAVLFLGTLQIAVAQSKASFTKPVAIGLADTISADDTNDSNFSDQMFLYPNPSTGKLVLSNKSENQVTATIFNIVGDPILREQLGIEDTVLDISDLPNGIYIVSFNNGKEIVTQRLIKR